MGRVEDVFGDTVDELRAPYDCIILDTRHIATVYPGDWTFSCGRLLSDTPAQALLDKQDLWDWF